MHTMPETLTATIETALAQARYEGNAFLAYLLEMALIAASEPARSDDNADLSETGQGRLLKVA
jgi:hypothetical protein